MNVAVVTVMVTDAVLMIELVRQFLGCFARRGRSLQSCKAMQRK